MTSSSQMMTLKVFLTLNCFSILTFTYKIWVLQRTSLVLKLPIPLKAYSSIKERYFGTYTGRMASYFLYGTNLKLSDTIGIPLAGLSIYRWLVGPLVYLTITLPNITYSVHILIEFIHKPLQSHYMAALCLFWYVKGPSKRYLTLLFKFSANRCLLRLWLGQLSYDLLLY